MRTALTFWLKKKENIMFRQSKTAIFGSSHLKCRILRVFFKIQYPFYGYLQGMALVFVSRSINFFNGGVEKGN